MGLLLNRDFSGGYLPSDNGANGRPNGFLRLDNLCLDEEGSLSLVNASQKINSSPFSSPPLWPYSVVINGTKQRYVGLQNGTTLRSSGNFSSPTTILSGGDASTKFGNGYGQVFVTSNKILKKDDGSTVRNWGIAAPAAAPSATPNSGDFTAFLFNLTNIITAVEGTVVSGAGGVFLNCNTNATSNRLDVTNKVPGGGVFDLSVGATHGTKMTSQDRFTINIVFPTLAGNLPAGAIPLVSFTLIFTDLNGGTFSKTFGPDDINTSISNGTGASFVCSRSDFTVVGNPSWANLNQSEYLVICSDTLNAASPNIDIGVVVVTGFEYGPLIAGIEGLPPYSYVQVNAFNSGAYIGLSAASPATALITIAGFNVLTPYTAGIDSQVNECWFFRRGGTLNQYYFVGKCAPGGTFTDNFTDTYVLEVNIPLNPFLASVATIPDEILGIVSNLQGRMALMTFKDVFITDLFDPDAFDTRLTLAANSNVGEYNLFVDQINDNTILLGTSKEIYQITGTFAQNPDGTFNVTITPLGVGQAPIAQTTAVYDSILYYIAADGWRAIVGGVSQLVSMEMNLLWGNQFSGLNRYGVSCIQVGQVNSVNYRMVAARDKLFTVVYHFDGTASVIVYDLKHKRWYRIVNNPNNFFMEDDGTILATFTSPNNLRVFDIGSLYDGTTAQSINLLTPLLIPDGNPKTRKDVFALKLRMNSGGSQVDVSLGTESSAPALMGTVSASGAQEIIIPINGTSVNLAKRFSLQLTDHGGAGVQSFLFTDWAIDYEARPEPLPYLRIPPDQMQTAGRKRIDEIPFVIDTLNSPVTVTPILDGVLYGTSQTVTTIDKSVASYKFTSEVYASSVGLILQAANGQLFEFYNMLPARTSDPLPDPVNFYRIPSTNLNTPSRKRIIHYAIIVDTKGLNATFTPFVDGVSYPSQIINTSQKTTVIYAFTTEVIGTDIWGTLQAGNGAVLECYGPNLDECISEKMPPPAKFYVIPNNNLGVPAKKRIRTIPLVINTKGADVTFTPFVDDNAYPPAIFNTPDKRTVLYYFISDAFGIDLHGTLSSNSLFEFYGMLQPTDVEVIPVGKMYDQIGPIQFDRVGKLLEFNIRVLSEGSLLNYKVIGDDVVINTGSIVTKPNVDTVYYVKTPRGMIARVFRIEFSSTSIFHRWTVNMRYNIQGKDGDMTKWVSVK